ncbi:TolC family protein [Mucilaginibacter gossypii]|uniref:TolC family protein n=1 Tax=Mucilaginibacter gossypii TaxID=551996 RepID=UPI000DCB6EBE|nr:MULTISPECIES: TolC family protein [Mucilaginibacter]QTE36158.1 TolC family protein [Mucilaginibacter gossypii]RAV59927.1 TolC family protein [Mucilaginibacter rubeus]
MTTQNNKTNHLKLLKQVLRPVLRGSIALIVLSLPFAASAQDRTITLDEAIKHGLENSKTLKLSNSKVEQAVSEYNQAKDEALPTGKVSYGYNHAEIPANRLALGESSFNLPNRADAYLGILTLNQTIFAGGKLKYARQSTDLLTQVARLDVENDKDQIVYDIISSYYNLYKVLQSKKVVTQNLTTVDAQIKQAQRFFEQGLVTKNDVLRFQLQRSNIEVNGVDLETNRRIINYNLNVLLGLPEGTQLNIDQIKEADRQVAPLTAYLDTAMAVRPEFKQFALRSRVAETNIKSIKANELPTLGASVAGYYVDVNSNPIPKSGNFITPLSAGLTLSWNFGSLWTNKNKVKEAQIQSQQVDINKSITTDRVKDEVNQSYQNYTQALEKVKLLQTAIDQAGENNKILESKYKSNIASATDRADAETLLYQAQINLELAKADAGLAYYTLQKSTGKINK